MNEITLTAIRLRTWDYARSGLSAKIAGTALVWGAITLIGVISLSRIEPHLVAALDFELQADFETYSEAARLAWAGGSPYDAVRCDGACVFRYAPVFAYFFLPFAWAGTWIWAVLHVVALSALPLRFAVASLLLWVFWWDVGTGSTMTFVLVAAWWAVRGNRWGVSAFLVATVLMPRPLMIPLAGWLLWNRPSARVPFVAGAAAVVGLAVVSGDLSAWTAALTTAGDDLAVEYNVAPSALIGTWWVPIGWLLAATLVRIGQLGLAGIALSPYWLPYYLLMGLIPAVHKPAGSDPSVIGWLRAILVGLHRRWPSGTIKKKVTLDG